MGNFYNCYSHNGNNNIYYHFVLLLYKGVQGRSFGELGSAPKLDNCRHLQMIEGVQDYGFFFFLFFIFGENIGPTGFFQVLYFIWKIYFVLVYCNKPNVS
jgi:hypothetical protein